MNFLFVLIMIVGLFAFSACRRGEDNNQQPLTAEEGDENTGEGESGNENGEAGEEGENAGEEEAGEDAQEEMSEAQGGSLSLPVVASELTEAQKASYTLWIGRTAVNTAVTTTVVCTLEGVEGSRVLKANKYTRFGRGDTVLCDLFLDGELMSFALSRGNHCLGGPNTRGRLWEIQEELENQVEGLQCEEQ